MPRPRIHEDTARRLQIRARDLNKYYKEEAIVGWAKTALMNAKRRARDKGYRCTLSLDAIIERAKQTTTCPILDVPLLYGRGHGRAYDFCASIDRIDNSGDYTDDNVAIISRRANALKGCLTVEELIKVGEYAQTLKG